MQPDPTQATGSSTTRSVSQWERALLAQWFASTDRTGVAAIAAAYVSERSHDDPRLRNMIVIAERSKGEVNFSSTDHAAKTPGCCRTDLPVRRLDGSVPP